MRAVVEEQTHVLAADDELDEVPPQFDEIAGWNNSRKRRYLYVDDLGEVAIWFEDFHKRTAEVIEDIPELTFTPAFENRHISKRRMLGKHALTLSKQIRREEFSKSASEDIDEGVSRLLAQRRPESEE
jgi:hypothetical protein